MPTISKLSNHWKRALNFFKGACKFKRFTIFIKFVTGGGGGGVSS